MQARALAHTATLAALASLVMTELVSAEQVTFTATIPAAGGSFDVPVPICQFDPALGILQSVKIDTTMGSTSIVKMHNTTAAMVNFDVDVDVDLRLELPGGQEVLSQNFDYNPTTIVLAAFEGTEDFMAPDGLELTDFNLVFPSRNYNPLDVPTANLFTGTGPCVGTPNVGDPNSVTLRLIKTFNCTDTAPTGVTLNCTNTAGAQVNVTYFYSPIIAGDCNNNGVEDSVDIDGNFSADCQPNGIPDECEPDCDFNGVPDDCEAGPCGACIPINRRLPSSLLLYPEFDNRPGYITVYTITNTSRWDAIKTHVVFVGRYGSNGQDLGCVKTNRYEDLTPGDTLTMVTSIANPQYEQGFFYAVAVDPDLNPISFDHLIGQLLVFDGMDALNYAINAVGFRAGPNPGERTDLDMDGHHDLNGLEYSPPPDELKIPRFLGQSPRFRANLILIGLSGGSQFDTTVRLTVYNDSRTGVEQDFTFRCWEKVGLAHTDFGDVFWNSTLAGNPNDPNENLAGTQEYGWYEIDGLQATTGNYTIMNPAVYAVHVEAVQSSAGADLPFEFCSQSGHLFPMGGEGDNEE